MKTRAVFKCVSAALIIFFMGYSSMGCAFATASSKSDLETQVNALVQANQDLERRVNELELKLRLLQSNMPEAAPPDQPSPSSPPTTNNATPPGSPAPRLPGTAVILPPPSDLTVYKLSPPTSPIGVPGETPLSSPPSGEQPPPLFGEEPDFIEPTEGGAPTSNSPPIIGPPPSSPGVSVEAATLYESALGQFQQGELNLAIEAFKLYLTKYPDSTYAPDALFYLGESLFSKRKYTQAMENYRRLLVKFPDSEKAPEALYKLGMCFLRLNDVNSAKDAFSRVVQSYPYSEAARSAEAELKKLE